MFYWHFLFLASGRRFPIGIQVVPSLLPVMSGAKISTCAGACARDFEPLISLCHFQPCYSMTAVWFIYLFIVAITSKNPDSSYVRLCSISHFFCFYFLLTSFFLSFFFFLSFPLCLFFSVICCILTFDPAKHAIPKTAEVTHSDGQLWEENA